jgi:hypothetical protein
MFSRNWRGRLGQVGGEEHHGYRNKRWVQKHTMHSTFLSISCISPSEVIPDTHNSNHYDNSPTMLGPRSARKASGMRIGRPVCTSTQAQSARARASSTPSLTRLTVP